MKLGDYLAANGVGKSAFGRTLSARMGGVAVPPQSVHRWTLPMHDRNYSVPRKEVVEAIQEMTGGKVGPADWYRRPRRGRPQSVSVAASRKAAAVVRRRREAAA